MKQKLYSVKDVKIGYNVPVVYANNAVAQRAFAAAVKDAATMLHAYPEDYELWLLGEMDTDTGVITASTIEYICGGKDYA